MKHILVVGMMPLCTKIPTILNWAKTISSQALIKELMISQKLF